ncbi:ATP-binding protein [Schaalia sp. 19OD2882]|uniref:uridine kinase family protein n=1 Tax=Schaalia sp. 19OD2882 TaxID=2794089 RepID=UPI001C1EF1AA|nr:ATP-binding protein [Schaalia sp. 19OD2882]QWW19920.1 ATP-binding protein [Schaalia sp. 19OD2882]
MNIAGGPSPEPLRARVIVLAGPSGSGKTSLSTRTGIRSLSLDHFYKDDTAPDMPRYPSGLIDWDDPASWWAEEAFEALVEICRTGSAQVPLYDIPSNRRTAVRTWALDEGEKVFIAEGIFASQLVGRLRDAGVLADALCIARSPLRNMWFRLLRDLGEGRKAAHVLLWRGVVLATKEPALLRQWQADGCRPVHSLDEAAQVLHTLAT